VSLKRVSIIGLGLMGGSLALALKRAGLATHIVGCGRQVLIDRAREMGAVDSGSASAAEAVVGSDFVFLCTPVETSMRLMREIAPHLKSGALLTDVGSTKQSFADAAREIFGAQAAARVLPGHPLAGREVSGLEHATADLYSGSVWALTPLDESSHESHQQLHVAIEALGARVVVTSPEEHDRILAYTSHLPQMLSTALALVLERRFTEKQDPALQIHAGGLRTMLRLAASDPAMWEQIAASNAANIAEALECIEHELRSLRESLGDAEFRKHFEAAREFAKFVKS
jgi:prephenate dehydrogenase